MINRKKTFFSKRSVSGNHTKSSAAFYLELNQKLHAEKDQSAAGDRRSRSWKNKIHIGHNYVQDPVSLKMQKFL